MIPDLKAKQEMVWVKCPIYKKKLISKADLNEENHEIYDDAPKKGRKPKEEPKPE